MVGLNEGSNMNKNIMGYFKSIQTFIRSLFYKQQEQTKQNKCTLQQEKYLKIGANICNIGFKSKRVYESEEYMYLYTINDIHYAIYLEDACEGVYIVEPIIIYDYKPNGELVDEDTKEILTGILETTQRLNTYNCTKALLEQL